MINEDRDREVVVYARVSTDKEDQLSALENQKDWYDDIFRSHPNWHFIHMYVDEGITGTSAKKRPAFMQMIHDADKKEFDLILTREVSRFARNTVDTLQYTRDLKSKGIEVYFINDNIRTFDGDGELRLTIMATLAQDESRKTSIRTKSGQKTSMEKGVFYGTGNILGYDRVGRDMVINPEQAETVRMIYDMYVHGAGIRKIKYELEKQGRRTATGLSTWQNCSISRVLRNPFYCGTIVYRKVYVPDYLEQKRVINFGEAEQIIVDGTHEPIVSKEQFNLVQQIMSSRRQAVPDNVYGKHAQYKGKRRPVNVWTKVLECKCGHPFNRRVWDKTKNGASYWYQCGTSIKNGTIKARMARGLPIEGTCDSPSVAQWKLEMMAHWVFSTFLGDVSGVIELADKMLADHIEQKEQNQTDVSLLYKKQTKLYNRLDNLIEMRADGEIDKDTFIHKKMACETQIQQIQEEIDRATQPMTNDIDVGEQLKDMHNKLLELVDFNNDKIIPESVIDAFVQKIIVSRDGFEWYLRYPSAIDPVNVNVEGRRSNPTLVITNGHNGKQKDGYIKIAVHTFTKRDALVYSKNPKQWHDLTISVFI